MRKYWRLKKYPLIVLSVVISIFASTTVVNAGLAPPATTGTTIGVNISTTGLLTVGGPISTKDAYQIESTNVLIASSTTYNTFMGLGAGTNTSAGTVTSRFGSTVVTPTDNTFLGYLSGQSNTTGSYNTAIGSQAIGQSNTNGSNNTAIGYQSMLSGSDGTLNTAIGYSSLSADTTGGSNTAIGSYALSSNTTGNHNVASGESALLSNTSGVSNVASGDSALYSNTTGEWNTALGEGAGYTNGVGASNANTFVGAETSYNSASDFASTTEIGYQAGYNNTGSLNTLLGYKSGYNITSGANNIIIGANVNAPAISSAPSNGQQLNIGNLLYGNGIYNGSTPSSVPVIGNIGIGTSTPTVPLQVTTAAANATTTVEFGKKGQTKGTCLKMYDDTGAVQYVSIQAGAFVISTNSCQ